MKYAMARNNAIAQKIAVPIVFAVGEILNMVIVKCVKTLTVARAHQITLSNQKGKTNVKRFVNVNATAHCWEKNNKQRMKEKNVTKYATVLKVSSIKNIYPLFLKRLSKLIYIIISLHFFQ